jgi:hypothetical protein
MTLICALFLTAGMAIAQEGGDDGSALNNEAIIEQATANNKGDIVQRGNANQAGIGQGKFERTFQDDDSDRPIFVQGTAEENEAFLRQVGRGNVGIITQG